MTTPKAHVALSRFLDLTKSAQMTVPKGQNDRTKSGGPYQKRNENAMTIPALNLNNKKLPLGLNPTKNTNGCKKN